MKTEYTGLRFMWRYKYFCSHSQKKNSALTGMMLILLSILIPFTTLAQQPVGSSAVKANFGIDADVYANRLQFDPLAGFPPFAVPAVGTDDFFENQTTDPGSGKGVIGTTAATVDEDHWNKISAADYKTTYCESTDLATRNHTYVQRMALPFGFVDFAAGTVWLDAVGARDNFSSGSESDSSVFTGQSNKNGDNPMTWNVGIGGSPPKNDLIDVAAHIRYDLTTANQQNPNGDLWGFGYATTLSADGNSHTDFEIYRAPVEYDPLTGFTNFQVVIPTGLNNYLDSMGFEGGHTAGLVAPDGTILRPGDLMIAVDFENGGTDPQFSIRIWVDPNNLTPWNIAPMDTGTYNGLPVAPCPGCPGKQFTFTGVFADGTGSGSYGWAEIRPNDLSQPFVFARVNFIPGVPNNDPTGFTTAAPWGNLTGSQATCDDNYEKLQVAEMGINFTAFGLGVDAGASPCFTLFGTLLVKTRSSSSFTSELKDFSGPYVFGVFFNVDVTVNDDIINCDSTTAYLCATVDASPGNISYSWTGPCILSYNADSSCVVVGCAGEYTVTASLDGGCSGSATSTVTDESVPATCSIDPAGPFCPGTTNQHCGPAGQTAYQWSISGNGSIQGSSTSQCVTVLAGSSCGSYTLELIVGEEQCADTCDMTFLVEDDTDPVISNCPADASFECIDEVPAPANVTATDDCDANLTSDFNEVQSNPGSSCNNVITRTWTFTDDCGNTATCVQIITVDDTTDPVITCASDISVQCYDDVPAPVNPPASDNCDNNLTFDFDEVESNPGSSCNNVIVRTWTVTDDCGNSASCSQTITVDDTTDPVITCASDVSVQCYDDVPAPVNPPASDNCDNNLTFDFNEVESNPGSSCNNVIVRTWTATDDCGNSASCSQTITVNDTEAPVLSGCPNNTSVQCIDDVPAPANVTANDNCDGSVSVDFDEVQSNPGSSCNNVITRTWTATDACGNTSSCSQTITVNDTTDPLITCAADDTIACGGAVNFTPPSAIDNCDPNPDVEIVSTITVDNPDGSKDHTRTWSATDACGNSSTCSQTIHEDPCEGDMHCTLTQGAYGNEGGKYAGTDCDSLTTTELLDYLLNQGNLVLGGGANTFTVGPGDAACIILRLPGGGPAKKLNGAATCANPVGIALMSDGSFKNVLVAQQLTLGLNLRWPNSILGSVALDGPYMTTMASTSCEIGQGVAVPGTEQTFHIPQSVLDYLGVNNTVADLYDLANAALAGTYVPGPGDPSLGDIAQALGAINDGFDECRILIGFSSTPPEVAPTVEGTPTALTTVSKGVATTVYPNPFNSNTTITFKTDVDTYVSLDIYTMSGTKVATLYDGIVVGGKVYDVQFNGSTLHDGIYIYRINTPDQSYPNKLIIIK